MWKPGAHQPAEHYPILLGHEKLKRNGATIGYTLWISIFNRVPRFLMSEATAHDDRDTVIFSGPQLLPPMEGRLDAPPPTWSQDVVVESPRHSFEPQPSIEGEEKRGDRHRDPKIWSHLCPKSSFSRGEIHVISCPDKKFTGCTLLCRHPKNKWRSIKSPFTQKRYIYIAQLIRRVETGKWL